MTFNLADRYPLVLNILLAALVIPYFAARSVSDMIRLHYAASALPSDLDRPAGSRLPFTGTRPAGARLPVAGTRPRKAYNFTVQRDVFNLTPATVDTAPVENEDLKVTLLGTSHLTGNRAFAIFEDQSGMQSVYRLGDAIPDVGKLVQVGKNRVIVEHNGHRVALTIPSDSLGQPDSDDDQPERPTFRRRRMPFIRNPMFRRGPPEAKAG